MRLPFSGKAEQLLYSLVRHFIINFFKVTSYETFCPRILAFKLVGAQPAASVACAVRAK